LRLLRPPSSRARLFTFVTAAAAFGIPVAWVVAAAVRSFEYWNIHVAAQGYHERVSRWIDYAELPDRRLARPVHQPAADAPPLGRPPRVVGVPAVRLEVGAQRRPRRPARAATDRPR